MKHVAWLAGAALVTGSFAALAVPSANSATPAGSAPAGSGSPAHAGHDAGPRETPEQAQFKWKYMLETSKKEHEITAHHVWTSEMLNVANQHWRRAHSTLRIRELAEDEHDTALVARADAYLKKIDDHFFTTLTDLTAKAPLVPPPPTITAPADQASMAVGTASTFKMSPYKDATGYYCALYQPGHYWSNWTAGTKSYGATPDCTIPADDPRWSKFKNGKAHFVGRAIVKGKSAKGTEMHLWSEPVKIDVVLTGGAAPAGSGTSPTPAPSSSAAGGSK